MSVGRTSGITQIISGTSGKHSHVALRGELVARGPNVMRGYWNNQKGTAAAFRNGFFRTGDLGYQDVDGYFYIQIG